jgi:hypothetical protein
MAQMAQKFATSERMGSQGFQAEQAGLGRTQQAEQFSKTMDFNQKQADVAQSNWGLEFDYNKYISGENLKMAKEQLSQNNRTMVEQLTGQNFSKMSTGGKYAYGVLADPTAFGRMV